MIRTGILTLLLLMVMSPAAMAEPMAGRWGLIGRLGAVVPLKDSRISGTDYETATGFAGGGGLIVGIGRNLAVEVEVIHAPSMDLELQGNKVSEAELTDVAVGVVYRMIPERRFVPYIGGGIDAIKGDIEDASISWTVGGHLNAGIDWFLNRSIILNLDLRGLLAAKSDITRNDAVVGKYDPASFIATAGVKLLLPEKL